MKKFFQEYFYYTRRERNGAFALIILCVLCVLAPRLYPFFLPEKPIPDPAALREAAERIMLADGDPEEDHTSSSGLEVAAPEPFYFDPNTADKETFVRLGLTDRTAQTIINYRAKGGRFYKSADFKKIYALREADYLRLAPFIRIPGNEEKFGDRLVSEDAETTSPARLFNFDPNTADEATLRSLGIPEKVVRVILNYRSKGGRFRKKEDLAKIYSLSRSDYERLEAYIQIEPSEQATKTNRPAESPAAAAPVIVDINKAGAEEWQRLRGIGPAIAGRIVSYREKLGGFASVVQVGETRGLADSTFQSIRAQLQPSSIFRPLSVNTASIDDLEAHPYLSKRQAEAIAAYRANHGNFKNFEEVKKVKALNAETLGKIEPYLSY